MEEKRAPYCLQLKAMLIRNIRLKKREKRKSMSEIIAPFYFLLIIILVKLIIPNPKLPAMKTPRGEVDLFEHFRQVKDHTVAVAPNNNHIQQFLDKVNELWRTADPGQQPIIFKKFNTTEELLRSYWEDPTSIPIAVIFETDDPTKGMLQYEIRTNPSFVATPATTELHASPILCRETIDGSGCPVNQYYYSDFVAIQALFDFTKLRLDSGQGDIKVPHMMLGLFPKKASTDEDILLFLRLAIPLLQVIALSGFIAFLLILIVKDKESKIKEGMKIMGLRDSVFWLSWFIIYATFVTVLSVIFCALVCLLGVFQHSNFLLIFLMYILFTLSLILFAFMITPLFDKSVTAGIVGLGVVILISLLNLIKVFLPHSSVVFWSVSLISSTGFALAMDKVITLELEGVGVTFDNWWSGPGMPFGGSLVMMALDNILYFILAYYLDSVIPSEYGSRRRPWFCFTPGFWCPRKTAPLMSSVNGQSGSAEEMSGDVESVASQMKQHEAIKIVDLHKTFHKCTKSCKRTEVKALNGINLTIYEGQITAILGHNGAGKTTLFNILTGMTTPTAGTVFVYGYNVRNSNDMNTIRRMTGFCPQHDTLLDLLTPREHLKLFAGIRGIPSSLAASETSKILSDMELEDKADTYVKHLSDSQKRKLSVGIAIIGDPKIIILDEPTAGVDVHSRRHTWSILQNIRQGKVILLTTHFMYEADILAERKAIISQGNLRCCGSSLFLKNKFGIGYHLTLELDSNANEDTITKLVTSHIPEAEKASHQGQELSFILPRTAVDNFAPLFSAIEREISSHSGINSYGVSMTTLEEVFLLLEQGDETQETLDNVSKKMVHNRALNRWFSLQRQKLHNKSSVYADTGRGAGEVQSDGVKNQVGEETIPGSNFELIETKPKCCQIFIAMLILLVRRNFQYDKIAFLIIIFIVVAGSLYLSNIVGTAVPSEMNALILSGDTYKADTTVTFHNATSSSLDDLVKALEASGVATLRQYNGSYSLLLDIAPNMAALNVNMWDKKQPNITVLYNDTMQHSLPVIMNLLSNAIYRIDMGPNNIVVKTLPFQQTSGPLEYPTDYFIAMVTIGAAFVTVPASLAVDMVYDREIKARNQLRVNGLTFFMYFLAYFVVLVAQMLLTASLIIGLIIIFKIPFLQKPPAFGTMAALIMFYCPASILFCISVSYIFDKMDTAVLYLPTVCMIGGCVPMNLVMLLNSLALGRVAMGMHIFLSLVDAMYLPFAIVCFVSRVHLICLANPFCKHVTVSDYLTHDIIILFVGMLLQIPIWVFILLMVDVVKSGGHISDLFTILQKKQIAAAEVVVDNVDVGENEDDDVRAERQKVADILASRIPNASLVVVQNLRKEFQHKQLKVCTSDESVRCCVKVGGDHPTVAVRNLSFSVDAGEVFGLLGHNGAGKTTTMKIMIGEKSATKGKVLIGGYNITSNISEAFQLVGYCPQFDVQWSNITVRQHLECYAAIRGVPRKEISRVIDMYLRGLQIQEHANKQAKHLSGETKRKLSFAMAMIGGARIVLLDEPSRGMDPRSKRFLWRTILASFQGSRGAILTTQAMEEVEALCTRVGIMVKGELRCIGSTQHLKNLYGAGYMLEVKLQGDDDTALADRQDDLQKFVSGLFPDATLEERFEDRMTFSVPQQAVASLAECFSQLEKAKTKLNIEDYSFSQTTLEQVFLKFADYNEGNGD